MGAAPEAEEIPWADEVAAAVATVGLALSPPGERTDDDQRPDTDRQPDPATAPAAEDGAAATTATTATTDEADEADDEIEPEDFAESFFWRSAVHDGPATPWRSLFS
ncbi:hypothetical protein BCD49_13210 [Pseudofrankia sp. EUN1h]|nr:hypothetical protein BCD49_13210 [Pseudofrankia sp. EUN1h]